MMGSVDQQLADERARALDLARQALLPHMVEVNGKITTLAALQQVHQWCEERYGRATKWYAVNFTSVWSHRGSRYFCFRDADSAFEFKMRWA